MNWVPAASPQAASALALVEALQARFVDDLSPGFPSGPRSVRAKSRADASTNPLGENEEFSRYEWLRDDGRHGGGVRYSCAETERFNRASVNVSSVHYDDEPQRKLSSATALSTIIHPQHPRAPSLHLHVSFTQWRDGKGSWRVMADLNPSHEDAGEKEGFEAALKRVAPVEFDAARAQGDRYFFIPALGRHRGVSHFYLEDFTSGDFEADRAFAERFVQSVTDTYVGFLRAARPVATEEEQARQLAYHSVYLFQVLTLDRGTTSGLMVHDQNDLGVMGSLPAFVDRSLLASWEPRMVKPQDELLRAIVAVLPESSHVTDEVRVALAQVVRSHYRSHPDAVALQAAQGTK